MITVKGKTGNANFAKRNLALDRIFKERSQIKQKGAVGLENAKMLQKAHMVYRRRIVSFILHYEFGIRSREMLERICQVLESKKNPLLGAERDILGNMRSQHAREASVEGRNATQRNMIGLILGDREKGELFWKDYKEIRETETPKRKFEKNKKLKRAAVREG